MARILIVDDSWLTRRSLNTIMTSFGHEIIEAENGHQGLTIAKEQTPDCILLDLLMPGLSGFDVLAEMKENQLAIPVIVVSADIQNTTREKCIALGAIGFLNKPPNEDELRELVNQAIKKGPES